MARYHFLKLAPEYLGVTESAVSHQLQRFATLFGLPMGSAFVLGAVAASASYIDAPAAVRSTFPEANPSIYLTASLGITFPFMVLAGVPIVWQMAEFWQGL